MEFPREDFFRNLMEILPGISRSFPLNSRGDIFWNLVESTPLEFRQDPPLKSSVDFTSNLVDIPPMISWRFPQNSCGLYPVEIPPGIL